jgi:hypothetical protein
MEGMTPREITLAGTDCGKHAAQAQAVIRLGLILETDEDSPAPLYMTHAITDGKPCDIFWGIAAYSSAGDEAGTAAVDAWAERHHVSADWEDGRYRAVMHLGGSYRYGVTYVPESVLFPERPAASPREPELAVAAA